MLPLSELRVLAVEQYGAGPWGTLYLADLGAEVIKIENLTEGGDFGRAVGPHWFGPGDSQFFQTFNRNKRSVGLDLKRAEGKRVFHDLVRTADGVLNNLRGDLPAKLGIDYAALKETNPRIVCAHLSAYGREGSRAHWPGYDYLMQAEAGFLSVTGEPDGPPTRFGLSMVDLITGLTAAFALVSGILGARATGMGSDLDISLFDTALHNLNYLGTWFLNAGAVTGRQPRSSHPSLTPSQLYRTRDGWIFVMCNKDKFWPILTALLDRPEWAKDPEFATYAARLRNRARITELLDSVFMQRTTADWLAHLSGKVPIAPVHDVEEALRNDFVAERGAVLPYHYPDGREAQMIAGPIRVAGEAPPQHAAPALGADTDAVLGALGYETGQIDRLRRNRIVC
jgi:succinate--hydroxymethylglutarate CoA-transferase